MKLTDLKILFLALSLMLGLPGFSQPRAFDSLLHKFDTFRKNIPQEKVFLNTDQEFYVTGETVWFKIFCLNGTTNKPHDFSKIVYVELIDEQRTSVLHTKIELETGIGSGSFFLPASINTGNYVLRAYTQWMKNFSPDFYFSKVINIVNPFVALAASANSTKINNTISLFPEGGHLVDGLRSKVAFRFTNPSGVGINGKGAVVGNNGDTLTRFEPLEMGIGHFYYRPQASRKDKVVITDRNGAITTVEMPQAQPAGHVLEIIDSTQNLLKVNVRCANTSGQSPYTYLLAHCRQILVHAEARLTSHGTTYLIDKTKLGDGVNHITLFNEALQPVCERLYFKYPDENLTVDITTDLSQYNNRQKVNVRLAVAENQDAPLNLSLSVFKLDSFANIENVSAYEYLWLSSDLNGKIDSASFYFSKHPKAGLAMDNLMLTHGWRKFKWNDITTANSKPSYYPEMKTHIVSGIVKDANGKPVAGALVYLASPDQIIRLYPSVSDADGRVKFETFNLYGSRKLYVVPADSFLTVDLNNPLSRQFSNAALPPLSFSSEIAPALNLRSIGMQVQDIYHQKTRSNYIYPNLDSTAFYGSPDETYFLDQYTRFPVMEEVMREYVPGVMIRKKKDRFHFIVLNTLHKGVFRESPLVLIDGVPVFNIDKVMSFHPHKVKKLEVVTRPYYLGKTAFEGIVSYTTNTGDLAGFNIDPSTLIVDYETLHLQREFFAPEYQTQQAVSERTPDQRHLLLWKPDLQLTKENTVSFYTSDREGKFLIRTEGISNTGVIGSGWATFEVKRVDH